MVVLLPGTYLIPVLISENFDYRASPGLVGDLWGHMQNRPKMGGSLRLFGSENREDRSAYFSESIIFFSVPFLGNNFSQWKYIILPAAEHSLRLCFWSDPVNQLTWSLFFTWSSCTRYMLPGTHCSILGVTNTNTNTWIIPGIQLMQTTMEVQGDGTAEQQVFYVVQLLPSQENGNPFLISLLSKVHVNIKYCVVHQYL